MKVQTRLSIFSSVVFGVIFAIISILIYVLYYQNAQKTIYNNLKKTSHITALFYLEEDELNKDEFAKVKAQFNEFVTNSFYQIYNETDDVSYGTQSLPVESYVLEKIRGKKTYEFKEANFFCYGIYYEDNQGDFVVIAREKTDVLSEQMSTLFGILLSAFLMGILVIVFFSKWMANMAYRPFRTVIKQVNRISTNNLDVQIKSPNTKDELQDLISTFNNLLSKIAETFVIQKNFANYVSHEFKTPLASMMGNLEVFSIKERSPQEYEEVAQKLIIQISQLEDILNALLLISDSDETKKDVIPTRIDELLWEIIDKLSAQYPKCKVLINIGIEPADEALLNVAADKTPLFMALQNLIENAIKYSQGGNVEISLSKNKDNLLSISIKDSGMGIPSQDLGNISKPFFRSDNAKQRQGQGIGLSIALKILERIGVEYTIESEINKGTSVYLLFIKKD